MWLNYGKQLKLQPYQITGIGNRNSAMSTISTYSLMLSSKKKTLTIGKWYPMDD